MPRRVAMAEQFAKADGDLEDIAGQGLQVTKVASRGRRRWGSNAACCSDSGRGQREGWANSAPSPDNQASTLPLMSYHWDQLPLPPPPTQRRHFAFSFF